jgi:8-oxo-dGTP pyrophosphatase MutT (NUDIX family)
VATVNQAGAIVFRRDAGELRVLVVTAKQNPHYWIFPKGHIERGETAEAAAVREAEEEAGVTGTPAGSVGSLSFTAGRDTIVVEYFVVAATNRGDAREGRRLAWCTHDEALERLTFDDARQLLRKAWPVMDATSDRPTESAKGRTAR